MIQVLHIILVTNVLKQKEYVLVTYDGNDYDYYWTSVDDAGQGVKEVIKSDKLTEEDVVSDIKIDDINPDTAIGSKKKIKIIDDNCSLTDGTALKKVPTRGGSRVGIDEACFVNPVVKVYADVSESVKMGDEINIYHEISGFDRCTKMSFIWEFNGELTNNEWDAVSKYDIGWVVRNTDEVVTFILNNDSIDYSWRIAIIADF